MFTVRLCCLTNAWLMFIYNVINICYWPAGRSVWEKTVTEVLKMLPEAAGRGQHFQARGHSFSLYGPTLKVGTHDGTSPCD